jgi:hypothetical protein
MGRGIMTVNRLTWHEPWDIAQIKQALDIERALDRERRLDNERASMSLAPEESVRRKLAVS